MKKTVFRSPEVLCNSWEDHSEKYCEKKYRIFIHMSVYLTLNMLYGDINNHHLKQKLHIGISFAASLR